MIHFAFVNAEGLPTMGGCLRALPEGALALPAPFTVDDLPRLRWTGKDWEVRGDLTPAAPPSAEVLAQAAANQLARARAEAAARVNERIARVRRGFVTDITGQDAIYLEKRAEAVAYLREAEMTGEPANLEDYPLLAGEVGLTAPTPWQLAQIWLHLSDAWKGVGALTERLRQRALIAVARAPDLPALDAAELALAAALEAALNPNPTPETNPEKPTERDL